MTEEQKAAYIIAQAACAMIEALGLQAENIHLAAVGKGTYGEEAFNAIINRYGIHNNACITLFHDIR